MGIMSWRSFHLLLLIDLALLSLRHCWIFPEKNPKRTGVISLENPVKAINATLLRMLLYPESSLVIDFPDS